MENPNIKRFHIDYVGDKTWFYLDVNSGTITRNKNTFTVKEFIERITKVYKNSFFWGCYERVINQIKKEMELAGKPV